MGVKASAYDCVVRFRFGHVEGGARGLGGLLGQSSLGPWTRHVTARTRLCVSRRDAIVGEMKLDRGTCWVLLANGMGVRGVRDCMSPR